jgi:hypothetical protein
MDARPTADRFDDPPGDVANDVPEPDTSMPDGWGSDPNWGSEVSVWEDMRGPDDLPKALSKKRKKKGFEHTSYGILAVHEKVTREYLAR